MEVLIFYNFCDVDVEDSFCCFYDICMENRLCINNEGNLYRGLCMDCIWIFLECF